jgi:hypothetical protein
MPEFDIMLNAFVPNMFVFDMVEGAFLPFAGAAATVLGRLLYIILFFVDLATGKKEEIYFYGTNFATTNSIEEVKEEAPVQEETNPYLVTEEVASEEVVEEVKEEVAPVEEVKEEPVKKAPVRKTTTVKKADVAAASKKTTTVNKEEVKKATNKTTTIKKDDVVEKTKTTTIKKSDVEAKAKTTTINKEDVKNATVVNEDGKTIAKVYHVSCKEELNKEKPWQVQATGSTFVKRFKYLKEAVEYAERVAANNGASVRVHSKAGKMRKYSLSDK